LPTRQRFAVEFDDADIRMRVLAYADASWNQQCRWSDIVRVCFRDGGLHFTDRLYLELRDRAQPIEILLEAKGGDELLQELGRRGLFPQPVFGEAVRSTDGGMYCWPPRDDKV
jgi:hypothetical protein